MIRICMICKEVIGEKEPLDDKSATHGICDKCLDLELTKIQKLTEQDDDENN